MATAESLKFSYEVLIRSVIKHLSDAATSEFLFIIDFFKTNSQETFNKSGTLSSSFVLPHRIFLSSLSAILNLPSQYLQENSVPYY